MTLKYLNLAGDGDEIAAVERVEREFGVTLPLAGAAAIWTAGDLFAVLLAAVRPDIASQPSSWRWFCWAICQETGDDPAAVGRNTLLILPPDVTAWGQITQWWRSRRGPSRE